MQSTKKTHYEVLVVLSAFLIYGGGRGILLNSTSVFVKPVTESLGFPRGLFTLYSTIIMVLSMLLLPKYGRIFAEGRFKKLMVTSALVCSLVPFGYAASRHLWQFYILAALQGIFINGIETAVVAVLINNWFVKKRGLATGIAYAGSGIVAAVVIVVTNNMIERFGWQTGYLTIGVFSLLVLLPATIWLPVRPQDVGRLPYGAEDHPSGTPAENENEPAAGHTDISFEEAVRTPAFYLLMASGILIALPGMGFTSNTAAYLSDLGYSIAIQSAVSSLLMLAMSGSKVLIGAILDRFGSLAGICVVCFSSIIATISMTLVPAGGILFAFLMAIFMGMGSTAGHVVASFLTNEYWGSRDFSRIYSYITIAGMLGNALSVPLPGLIYDTTGSYLPAWYLMIVVALTLLATELGAFRCAGKAH